MLPSASMYKLQNKTSGTLQLVICVIRVGVSLVASVFGLAATARLLHGYPS
jgi:hypothetical protein